MHWNELAEEPCPIAKFLSVFGDRWTLLILRQAFRGTTRFETFQAQLDISPTSLTSRLKGLVSAGVLDKFAYQEKPARYEYRLTRKGIDVYPVVMSMVEWGTKHFPDERGSEYVLEHTTCGHEFVPTTQIHCAECKSAAPALEVRGHYRGTTADRAPDRTP